MAFELIVKQSKGFRKALDANTIRVTKNRIVFNDTIGQALSRKGFVEIYIDKIEKKVGLKPSTDNVRGFKLTKKNNDDRYYHLTASSFCKRILSGSYLVFYDEGMYIFEVSEIAG